MGGEKKNEGDRSGGKEAARKHGRGKEGRGLRESYKRWRGAAALTGDGTIPNEAAQPAVRLSGMPLAVWLFHRNLMDDPLFLSAFAALALADAGFCCCIAPGPALPSGFLSNTRS